MYLPQIFILKYFFEGMCKCKHSASIINVLITIFISIGLLALWLSTTVIQASKLTHKAVIWPNVPYSPCFIILLRLMLLPEGLLIWGKGSAATLPMCLAESRGFSPGAPVSSHREVDRVG